MRLWPAAGVLLAVHLLALLAGYVAPYDPAEQHRDFPYAPPMRVHWAGGRLAVYCLQTEGDGYREDPRRMYPVRWFPESGRLFAVDPPGSLFLLGTDAYGRDQFSRLLYGGRISLAAGLLGTALSLALGSLLGALAGFYTGWCDAALMRLAELFLALPWFYLLLGVRAFLPLTLTPAGTFVLIVSIVGIVGWARPARLVRGVVLSAREREYVHAARGFGASDAYLLRCHILPQCRGVVLTQAGLLVPQYILAEVGLSFLGLGAGEPAASWGSMLAPLRDPGVLAADWWMASPALLLVPVVLAYHRLARAAAEFRT